MKQIEFTEIKGQSGAYYLLLAVLGAFIAAGLFAAYYMESNGHHVTGMTNQVAWGIPHVFAVFLIVAASGALNAASIASVFGRSMYKPLARISGLLAISLLIGGLTVLVLDLGRPDRLIVAMTHYNFRSIFAWNIFLYVGFIVVVIIYLWMMMERRMNHFSRRAGIVAFIWRLTLTTGTGSIFGFLVARQAYDSAILAPMFVIMSFSFGLAILNLIIITTCQGTGRPLGLVVQKRLKNLLGVFVAAVLYFVAVFHLTNIYMSHRDGVEKFILLDGGIYTELFWWVQVLLGSVIPMILLFHSRFARSRKALVTASSLVIVGGLAQVYVIIIGGQAYPLQLFPGMKVSSSFYDGVVNSYTPSLPEIMLGLGGIALALIIVALAFKVLRFFPNSLADADVDIDAQHPLTAEKDAHESVAPGEQAPVGT